MFISELLLTRLDSDFANKIIPFYSEKKPLNVNYPGNILPTLCTDGEVGG